jgi:uncharacterized protein with PIN domain
MYYYCPKCNKKVSEIKEIYHEITEYRKWNGECYELTDTSLGIGGSEPDETRCNKCNEPLTGQEAE